MQGTVVFGALEQSCADEVSTLKTIHCIIAQGSLAELGEGCTPSYKPTACYTIHTVLKAQTSLNLLRLPAGNTKGRKLLQGYAWEMLRGGTMAKTRSPTRISALYLPCS